MEEIAISKFKATCLAVLERVRKTGQPIIVTRRGVPVAEIVPSTPDHGAGGWLGSLRSTGRMIDDLIEPAAGESVWAAHRP